MPAAGNPIVPFDEEVIKSLILSINPFLVIIFFNSVSYIVLMKECILKLRVGNLDDTQHTTWSTEGDLGQRKERSDRRRGQNQPERNEVTPAMGHPLPVCEFLGLHRLPERINSAMCPFISRLLTLLPARCRVTLKSNGR